MVALLTNTRWQLFDNCQYINNKPAIAVALNYLLVLFVVMVTAINWLNTGLCLTPIVVFCQLTAYKWMLDVYKWLLTGQFWFHHVRFWFHHVRFWYHHGWFWYHHGRFWFHHLRFWFHHLRFWFHHMRFCYHHMQFWYHHMRFWFHHGRFWYHHMRFWFHHMQFCYHHVRFWFHHAKNCLPGMGRGWWMLRYWVATGCCQFRLPHRSAVCAHPGAALLPASGGAAAFTPLPFHSFYSPGI